MATGDIKWFAQGLLDLGNKIHDLDTDTINLGIVTNTPAPTIGTAAPHWGGTGTTNFATTQVSTGGGYTGPVALASKVWTLVGTVPTFQATDVVVPQHASGFTNGAYGIIYNASDANKRAIGWIEISSTGVANIQTGSITLNFQGGGTDILKLTPQ